MRSCVNMQLAYYLGTIAESLCHIFGMPSSKFNEIVAAFSCQGNRAKSAVRMSRRCTARDTQREGEREIMGESEQAGESVIRAPSSSLALACLLRRCPIHKRTARWVLTATPAPLLLSSSPLRATKVGQLHRQCGMKFELSSAC